MSLQNHKKYQFLKKTKNNTNSDSPRCWIFRNPPSKSSLSSIILCNKTTLTSFIIMIIFCPVCITALKGHYNLVCTWILSSLIVHQTKYLRHVASNQKAVKVEQEFFSHQRAPGVECNHSFDFIILQTKPSENNYSYCVQINEEKSSSSSSHHVSLVANAK